MHDLLTLLYSQFSLLITAGFCSRVSFIHIFSFECTMQTPTIDVLGNVNFFISIVLRFIVQNSSEKLSIRRVENTIDRIILIFVGFVSLITFAGIYGEVIMQDIPCHLIRLNNNSLLLAAFRLRFWIKMFNWLLIFWSAVHLVCRI